MKKWIWWVIAAGLATALVIWIAWGNQALERTDITVTSDHLPKSFDGFRIVHISDLHNAEFGEGNEKLLNMIRTAQPDIIAITGDIIDSRRTDIQTALAFAVEAVKIAPCYYVTGNHEIRVDEYTVLEQGLLEAGVAVLRGQSVTLEREGEQICILGVDDPTVRSKKSGEYSEVMVQMLDELEMEGFCLLLSHRPELFEVYCKYDIDLVLSGHVHGGQFRLPFVGGLYGPDEGFFPKYDAGLYTQGVTNMVISRGLGNSLFPFRVNNRPEVVVITLKTAETET